MNFLICLLKSCLFVLLVSFSSLMLQIVSLAVSKWFFFFILFILFMACIQTVDQEFNFEVTKSHLHIRGSGLVQLAVFSSYPFLVSYNNCCFLCVWLVTTSRVFLLTKKKKRKKKHFQVFVVVVFCPIHPHRGHR